MRSVRHGNDTRPWQVRARALAFAGLLGVASGTSGCFLSEVLPEEPKKTRPTSSPGGEEEPEPEEVDTKAPPVASPSRLIRRLSLDLLGRLPEEGDMAKAEEDELHFGRLVDAWLASDAARRTIATMHTQMWHLSADRLPDLDRYIAGGDTTLSTELTEARRARLVEEPTLRLRHVLERRAPFSAIFSGAWTIAHQDDLDLWGLVADGTPWPGEPYRFAEYGDGRPGGGVLVGNGLLAAFASRADPALRHRTARILTEVSCLALEAKDAHKFYDLSGTELAGDMQALAATKSPCQGCHGHFEKPGSAFAGLGQADTFGAWLAYASPTSATTGTWAGKAFANGTELAELIGVDPRTQRCEALKLLSRLYQRPPHARDVDRLAVALDRFEASGEDLGETLKPLLKSPEYTWEVVSPKQKKDWLYGASGVRFLSRTQWQRLLEVLIPGVELAFPAALDPGFDEGDALAPSSSPTPDWMVPTGRWWRAVDRLAREAATAIIAAELADTATAATRRLLNVVPDGSGAGASTAVVRAQIQQLWRATTADSLAVDEDVVAGLTTLWTKSLGSANGDDEAAVRLAWRAVLVGVLTHPRFLTY